VISPAIFRLAAFVALGLFGALHWSKMVAPAAGDRAFLGLVLAAALGGGLVACGRLHGRRATAAAVGLAALGFVLALVAAGLPLRMLLPGSWGEAVAAIADGIAALPQTAVPYRGVDEWVRIVLLAGCTALLWAAAALAFWPGPRAGRRHASAALALIVLYAVPAVELAAARPFLAGAAFTVLLAGFLWLEHVRGAHAFTATVLVVIAALVGVGAGVRLDADRPWLDYEALASSLGARGVESFVWDHRYGPLDWPRDGREVLRVRIGGEAAPYWKAVNLDTFDGARWSRGPIPRFAPVDVEDTRPEWEHRMRVVVRSLRSRHFIGAGTTLAIPVSARVYQSLNPGTFVTTGRPLRRGDSYVALVYTPRPTAEQLELAGTEYPGFAKNYLSMFLPPSAGGPRYAPNLLRHSPRLAAEILFAPWGEEDEARFLPPERARVILPEGVELVQKSRYARLYALTQRLRARSATPYEFVKRVERYFNPRRFRYDESPLDSTLPLERFVFGDRRGYCQQFSGAMALMLRMGGVPARVAAGFTPGTYDKARREHVVRDVDAHSWVEAYFPGIGWVPFDPTPASAPPAAQADGARVPSAAAGDSSDKGTITRAAASSGGEDSGGGGWRTPALVVAIAAIVLAGIVRIVRGPRRRFQLGDPQLAELERALWRSRRVPAPQTTLSRLEQVLGGSPGAQAYLRKLREARFGYGAGGPGPAERRALRRELAAGLGVAGRIRALWALPPRLRV
jgi:transglutaminase-like putative cysteine protease